jgi:pilus assembly protein CpaB
VLAVAATTAVALYVRGIEKQQKAEQELTEVVVTKHDIAAGSRMDELLSEGAFTTRDVPEDAVVDGGVTSLKQLEGRTTSSPILAGEQISTARLEGSQELPGGSLGIPAGHTAVNVALPAPAVIGGDLRAGDRITIYAHFANAGQVKAKVTGDQTGSSTFSGQATVTGGGGMTVTLVPEVQVLKIIGEVTPPGSTTGVGTSQKFSDMELAATLALTSRDAEKVIFAKQQGEVYFALLPPGEKGTEQKPLTFGEVMK